MGGVRLVPWTAADLVRRLDDVLTVYGEAMGYPPEMRAVRRGYVASHSQRDGFRAVATLDAAGRLLGFGYGYLSAPGQWWHDQVRAGLRGGPGRAALHGAFEVVELHVRPGAQGHGLGGAQLRALLSMTGSDRVVLSTPEAEESASRAWRLYRRLGFTDILRHFYFPGDERAFAVLGRPLPLDPPAYEVPGGAA
jgi:ribosomal protein S18 acetylase RimI-like enzyme